MMKQTICPLLVRRYARSVIRRKVFHIFGVPESQVDEWIRPVVARRWSTPDVQAVFGILAHYSIVDVKFSVTGRSPAKVQSRALEIARALKQVLGSRIYGEDDDTLESIIGARLKAAKKTLSVAESCTGGLLAGKITSVPGSSDYFKEGVVVYSNKSKIKLLNVSARTLAKHGAVSEQTAAEMARGMVKKSGTDLSLSVTGIAGPSGGTKQKPVGTVCFGIATPKSVHTQTRYSRGTRAQIRDRAVLAALDILRISI